MDDIYDKFSKKASAAIAEAVFCAHTVGSAEVDEADLLYGLAKASPEIYTFLVARSVVEEPLPVSHSHSINSILQRKVGLTESAKNIISKAQELRVSRKQDSVSTAHLFESLVLGATTLKSDAFQKLKDDMPALYRAIAVEELNQEYNLVDLPREVLIIALLKHARKHSNWRKDLLPYLSKVGISEQEIAMRL